MASPMENRVCAAAKEPGGSWGEYVWPKPVAGADGEITYTKEAFRKVSYMIAVDGQPYQLGAGIYNDPMTIAGTRRAGPEIIEANQVVGSPFGMQATTCRQWR